jgi:hypothetical protein
MFSSSPLIRGAPAVLGQISIWSGLSVTLTCSLFICSNLGLKTGGGDSIILSAEDVQKCSKGSPKVCPTDTALYDIRTLRVSPVCCFRPVITTVRVDDVCFSNTRRPPYNDKDQFGSTTSRFGVRLPCVACRVAVGLHTMRFYTMQVSFITKRHALLHLTRHESFLRCKEPPEHFGCYCVVLTGYDSSSCRSRDAIDSRCTVDWSHRTRQHKNTPCGTLEILRRGHALSRAHSDTSRE